MNDYLLEKFKLSLYLILDPQLIGNRTLLSTCREIIKGGASIIQYRDKTAKDELFLKNASLIHDITKDSGIPLIINDRVTIAKEINAEGVHVGASDISLSRARQICGKNTIIGFSVHNMEEFSKSGEADYLGIGSIFPSTTKPDVNVCGLPFLELIRDKTEKPLIAIGGINTSNVLQVINSGADGIAVISSIFSATKIFKKVKEFSKILYKRRYTDG